MSVNWMKQFNRERQTDTKWLRRQFTHHTGTTCLFHKLFKLNQVNQVEKGDSGEFRVGNRRKSVIDLSMTGSY